MGFFSLLMVTSIPVVELLLVASLGAFLASSHINLLSTGFRRDLNKIVVAVFFPSLVFSSLAKTATLQDLLSWWFIPVNIAITFLIGGCLGWIVVKILRPECHLEGLIIANCSTGNIGGLMLLIIPSVCGEAGNPFGDESSCGERGISYVSLSLALGGVFLWTYTYSLMRKYGERYEKLRRDSFPAIVDEETVQMLEPLLSSGKLSSFLKKIMGTVHKIVVELMEPPTIAAIIGLVVGAIPWIKSLIIGESAPLRVIQVSINMLGDATLPCINLILGGNLTSGLRKSAVKGSEVLAIGLVRYIALPISGIAVVKAANAIGFLTKDPLFHYVLLTQFSLPPAVAIGAMAQQFGVGQEESSVIFLWMYMAAAFALTFWSTVFMYIISY